MPKHDYSGEHNRKLFIGALSNNTTTESLKQYYEQFGKVVDAVVMRDPATQRSRCFGFVTFETEESVDAAQAARPHTIDEKQVDSKRAIPRDDTAPESKVPCKRIFIGGLRKDVTEDEIKEYFSTFGTVTDCFLMKDKATGSSRGFGFVTFDDNDAVDKVIVARPHTISQSKADVKKALPKEELTAIKSREYNTHYSAASYRPQYGGWQNNYGPPPPRQPLWHSQQYSAPAPSYGAYGDGWGSSQASYPGGWSEYAPQSGPNAPAGIPGGFGSYNQEAAHVGGPVRGGYGGPVVSPYERR